MSPLLHWLTSPEWTHVVGALLHSLWQGAILAVALALVLRRLTNPVTRYRCALGALGLLLIANLITWAVLNAPQPSAPVASPVPTLEKFAAPIPPPPNPNATDKIIAFVELPQPQAKINWTAWIALAWMFGALIMLGRASIKVAGAEKLRRSCQPLNDEPIALLVAEACRAVKLTRKIRVAVTDKLTSPAVVGVLVPTLILPLSLFTTLTPTQIQFVLLHELAHIRRGDYLANLFQLFAEALWFFNPAVWWISHQIRREREACCDALAIELSGAPADYARTLVHVAENILHPAPDAAPAFGDDGHEPSSLADRVQRLLIPGYRPTLRLTWRAMLTAMCVGGTLLFLSAMGARNVVGAVASNVTDAASKPATYVLETINSTADSENGSFTQPKWERSWSSRFEKQNTSSGGSVMVFFPPREELFAVLEQIKFERVFIQNTKLSEVLAELDKALLATDPKKIGFRLLMPPDWVYPAKRDGIDSVMINMPSELRDMTMRNLLESIVSSASRPIRYNFGANSASFEMKCDVPTNMWFERFKVDRKTFLPFIGVADSVAEFDLKKDDTINAPDKIGDAIKKRFLQAGVDLSPPNHVLYTNHVPHKTGPDLLYIYAPKKDIEVIKELLSGTSPNVLRDSPKSTVTVLIPPPQENLFFRTGLLGQTIDPFGFRASNGQDHRASPEHQTSEITEIRAGHITANITTGEIITSNQVRAVINGQTTNAEVMRLKVPTTSSATNQSTSERLYTREYRVSPKFLHERVVTNLSELELSQLAIDTNHTAIAFAAIRLWIQEKGVELDPTLGKSFYYKASKGTLLVRATESELDVIETALRDAVFESAQRDREAIAFAPELTPRTFQLEPTTIARAIETQLPQFKPVTATNVTAGLRALLESTGADLSPPKTIFYNDRAGGLFVRATPQELDAIEELLQVIGRQPPQVNVKAVFVELPLGKDHPKALAKLLEPVTPESGAAFTGILTPSQFKLILRTLQTNAAVKILAVPQVTTLSGRQAQLQVADVRTIVSGMTAVVTNGATNLVYQSQAMPFGPVLDVLPTVSNDGYTIQMTLSPTITEFLGYEDAKKLKLSVPDDKAALPLPLVRKRQMSTSANVWDGQTIVLGNFSDQILATPAELKNATQAPTRPQSKQLLVFVTPTIIDQAGNPANGDSGVPSALPLR